VPISQHDFILLDRSGSMASMWNDALGSIDSYVRRLARERIETQVTFATFDSLAGGINFDIVRNAVAPKEWERLYSGKTIDPRGNTPLSDAIGRLVALADRADCNKTVLLIITDGEENASCDLDIAGARAMLERCRKRGWQVVFIGCNFDNTLQAKGYGAADQQVAQATAANMETLLYAIAAARVEHARSDKPIALTDQSRKKLR
jgi:hypothetical protein